MQGIISNRLSKEIVKSSVFDVSAIAFIYLIPVISHMLVFPIYYLEPMRLMLILAIAHTSKKNALVISATLPLFSFLISAHPVFIKSLLIMGELAFNAWLFFYLSEKFKNKFSTMLLSVAASKMVYYVIKFGLLSFALLEGSLVATPIAIQVVMMLLLSAYFLIPRKS
ncbi:MAG: hypothetical protein PHW27_10125 [Melioribacteraceae bacterium]|nr:hypothetical protein [Melioribacteraceae bacterium]MDD3558920.1 hypothetical protein [Melioribacteraceae bacterium]